MKRNFYKNIQVLNSLWILTGKNSLIRQAFFGRVEETAFYVSIDIFWGEFQKNFLCHFWTTSITYSVVKTVFYVCRQHFNEGFFWGNCIFFLSVSLLEETFSTFWQNTSNKIVETEIYVSTRNLWRKLSFLKKLLVFLFFWFRNERKIFNLLTTFRQGCKNCFRRVHRIILRSLVRKKDQIQLSSLHTELTIFGIQSKIFQQGCQKNHPNF